MQVLFRLKSQILSSFDPVHLFHVWFTIVLNQALEYPWFNLVA